MVSEYSDSVFDLNVKLTDEPLDHTALYHGGLITGSLTAAPSTEGAYWNLLKVHKKVCQRQLDTLKIGYWGDAQRG